MFKLLRKVAKDDYSALEFMDIMSNQALLIYFAATWSHLISYSTAILSSI